ncbi:membrane dipeptidase [Francisella sp. LA112445]|uniref:dipeptidase n=1 Tax=Francisella sp. LA112445 TaxID=1395624 RepID=UPI001788D4A9|nr:membrane dipeptidase [Francisella sp. LA112445]QIW10774.1 hypothetical protein FIP56_08715 [Francisella sp. LA112445]
MFIIDGCCPLLVDRSKIQDYREGGCSIVTPTVGQNYGYSLTYGYVKEWFDFVNSSEDLLLIKDLSDLEKLQNSQKLGVVFHFQGTDAIEGDIDNVTVFKQLGVNIMQLTYNKKNLIGSGCEVEQDQGLTSLGLDFIDKCNKEKVIIDCAHTGEKTSLQAIERSSSPVIISHANPYECHATHSSRNVSRKLIKAIADNGGVIGLTGFPPFLTSDNHPSTECFMKHLNYLIDTAGIEHVSLGLDYYEGMSPYMSDVEAKAFYDKMKSRGDWSDDYTPPPHYYPEGIETPKKIKNLIPIMQKYGYKDSDIAKVMGENLLRIYKEVW